MMRDKFMCCRCLFIDFPHFLLWACFYEKGLDRPFFAPPQSPLKESGDYLNSFSDSMCFHEKDVLCNWQGSSLSPPCPSFPLYMHDGIFSACASSALYYCFAAYGLPSLYLSGKNGIQDNQFPVTEGQVRQGNMMQTRNWSSAFPFLLCWLNYRKSDVSPYRVLSHYHTNCAVQSGLCNAWHRLFLVWDHISQIFGIRLTYMFHYKALFAVVQDFPTDSVQIVSLHTFLSYHFLTFYVLHTGFQM